jgi:hypothetical protein
MELQPLAAEIRLDAAFLARLVTDLIAALRHRNMRSENYGQQCDRAPLHFFLVCFRAVRRFATAFFDADFFGEAEVLAAPAAMAEPRTVLRRLFARLGVETAAGCGDTLP